MIDSNTRRKPFWRTDACWAALASVAAFVVYLQTLLPDLGGPEDTPKFQYLGAVLGTAHEPGYPLHTLLSHAFSLIPIGTIAYRANLMSAVMAALAVGLVARLALTLGVSHGAALFGSLTIAFGPPFWTYANLAEVYTLSAMLCAGIVYWMVRWGQTGRPTHLYLASAFFTLELANHLTIAGAVPAIAIFLLIARSRQRLTPRVVVTAGLIVVSGFALYSYVWIRTLEHAKYLEAQANSFGELVDVVRARNYADFVMNFTWRQIRATELPRLWRVVGEQLGRVGLVAGCLGLVALWIRDWRSAFLVTSAALGITVFVVDIVGDLPGFMVTPLVLAAVPIAFGGDLLVRLARLIPLRAAGPLAGAVVAALVVRPLSANYADDDWSRRLDDATYFRAFVEQLPQQFGLIPEEYTTDCMVNYAIAIMAHGRTDLIRPTPGPESVQSLLDRHVPVYSFEAGQFAIAPFGYDFEPVDLEGPTLSSALAGVHKGAHLALAAVGTDLPAEVLHAAGLDALVSETDRPGAFRIAFAPLGQPPVFLSSDQAVERSLDVPRPRVPGQTAALKVHAGPDGAMITLGESSLGVTTRGIVAAVVDETGRIRASYVATAPDFRVRLPWASHKLFEVVGRLPTTPFGDAEWHDLTDVSSDGLFCLLTDNYRAFDATTVLYAANDTPLRPAADENYHGGRGTPEFQTDAFDRNDPADATRLNATLAADHLDAAIFGSHRYAARIQVKVNDEGESSASLVGFGGVPAKVVARALTDRPALRRAIAFPMPSRRLLSREPLEDVGVGDYFEWLVGSGWERASRDADGGYRWTASPDAEILLPLARVDGLTLTMRVGPPTDTPGTSGEVRLSANGRDLGPCVLRPGWQSCRWMLPADAIRVGGNTLSIHSSSMTASADGRSSRGVGVRWIRVQR